MRVNTEDGEADRSAALRRRLDDALAATAAGAGEPGDEGLALLDRERWSEAAEVLEERLNRAAGGRDRVHALTGLGEAYLRARRPVAAINFFGQALEILRKEGAAAREQAAMFVHLADAARLRGDPTAERAALDRAARLVGEGGPTPSRGPS